MRPKGVQVCTGFMFDRTKPSRDELELTIKAGEELRGQTDMAKTFQKTTGKVTRAVQLSRSLAPESRKAVEQRGKQDKATAGTMSMQDKRRARV